MANKGSEFERAICKELSLWWTNNKRDDVFWRTAGSGARAKTRSKSNKTTFGQCGDIQATDPIGQPLIDVCSIELKRGYSKSTFSDLVERPENAAEQMYEKFINQAIEDHKNAGSLTWILIVKRDRKETLVFMPQKLKRLLSDHNAIFFMAPCFHIKCRFKNKKVHNIYGTTLKNFFLKIKPSDLQKISDNNIKKGK